MIRHRLAALSLLLLTSFAADRAARADTPYQTGVVSLGLGLGDPSALDVKFWTGNGSGFNLGIGLERFDDVLGVYGEYELGLAAFRLGQGGARGVFYLGVGGAVALTDEHTSVAVVVPIGLDFRFRPPVDLFIEARPGIGVLHRPAFGIGGQIGVRYRF